MRRSWITVAALLIVVTVPLYAEEAAFEQTQLQVGASNARALLKDVMADADTAMAYIEKPSVAKRFRQAVISGDPHIVTTIIKEVVTKSEVTVVELQPDNWRVCLKFKRTKRAPDGTTTTTEVSICVGSR